MKLTKKPLSNQELFHQNNFLNLPKTMNLPGGDLEIKYLATGEKLQKKSIADSGETTTVDYCGNIEYENGVLAAIHHSTGRIIPNEEDGNNPFRYQFQLTDHLGNVRVVFEDKDQSGNITKANPDGGTKNPYVLDEEEIIVINHYYPFGMQFGGLNGAFWNGTIDGRKYDYSYNGKELNEDFGLDWSDYGARWYDAAIGRWGAVDPLAENPDNISWTPYTYVWSNPMNAIDPDGRNGIITVDKENKTIQVDATIHYSKEDNGKGRKGVLDYVTELLGSWNSKTGTIEGEEGDYSISFSIKIDFHDTDEGRDEAFQADETSNRLLIDNETSYNRVTHNRTLTMTSKNVSGTSFSHEVGHLLGLPDDDEQGKYREGKTLMGLDNIMYRPGSNRRKINQANLDFIGNPVLDIINEKRVKRRYRKKNQLRIKMMYGRLELQSR